MLQSEINLLTDPLITFHGGGGAAAAADATTIPPFPSSPAPQSPPSFAPLLAPEETHQMRWPLIEALAIWFCIGSGCEERLERGNHKALPTPSLTMADLARALSDAGRAGSEAVLSTWLGDPLFLRLVHAGAKTACVAHTLPQPDYRWLQLVPALLQLGIEPTMPRITLAPATRDEDEEEFAKAMLQFNPLAANCSSEGLVFIVAHAPTLLAARPLLTRLAVAVAGGGAGSETHCINIRAALQQFASQYDWPTERYHNEIDFMVAVICSRAPDGIIGDAAFLEVLLSNRPVTNNHHPNYFLNTFILFYWGLTRGR